MHRPVPRRRRAPPRARTGAVRRRLWCSMQVPSVSNSGRAILRARPIGPSPGRGIPWSRHAESPERGASRLADPRRLGSARIRRTWKCGSSRSPTDAERRAIVAAIEDAAGSHPAYASAWRRAGLPGSDGDASPAQAATPRRPRASPKRRGRRAVGAREYGRRGALRQGPRGQSWRDRRSGLPDTSRARHRDRRRVLGRRPRRAPRGVRGRSVRSEAGRPASYLRGDRIIELAQKAGAEAIHPGYGFLAENAAFARACANARLVWIRPPPEAIEAMGSKIAARRRMSQAGVPVVPDDGARRDGGGPGRIGDDLGWPIAIKASAGGGGKGLKVVAAADQAEQRALESARREGEACFSDATVVERYLEDPRHVEFQVLADAHGNVIHLGERDCTIQRRHQKLVEETPPSPAVDEALRERIGAIAVDGARGWVPVGRHDRGVALARGRVLLPRDEHADPGRAHRDRARDRGRPRSRAGAHRRRRAALAETGRRASAQPRSSAGSTPRTCRPGSCPRPARSPSTASRRVHGVRVDSGVGEGAEISPLYDPMVASCTFTVATGSTRGGACCGRSPSSRSAV